MSTLGVCRMGGVSLSVMVTLGAALPLHGQDLEAADVHVTLDSALHIAQKTAATAFPELSKYLLYSIAPRVLKGDPGGLHWELRWQAHDLPHRRHLVVRVYMNDGHTKAERVDEAQPLQEARGQVNVDSSTMTPRLDEVYASFRGAYARLDPIAVAGLYADDALYLAGNSELRRGAAAIQAGFEEFFSSVRRDNASLELRFRILRRTLAPGLATDVGYYRLVRVRGAERGRPSIGRFVAVLREEADGRWRFVIDSYTDASAAEYDRASSSHEP